MTTICLISSHGGHLRELQTAIGGLEQIRHCYWVTCRTCHTEKLLQNKQHYFVMDPHLSKAKYLFNAIQSFVHLLKERPKVIISTGAGIAIPTMLIGKYLFRAKIIFIESAANVQVPSHTAKFMYPRADLFLVQWAELAKKVFPGAQVTGVL